MILLTVTAVSTGMPNIDISGSFISAAAIKNDTKLITVVHAPKNR